MAKTGIAAKGAIINSTPNGPLPETCIANDLRVGPIGSMPFETNSNGMDPIGPTRRSFAMHVSGSGPLGVLLMIAPLAAIPVFAILGVPHFAPVSASGTDDDDFVELGETSSRPPAPSVPLP